ncbi:thiol-disulfide oxidoreductase DCC family protein [Pseudochryseolinea flava]|uniref:Thiol-disulfide oxidoreductase DCC family protein n=1 Tax=Pseudochryseolinea flava TaxID=2059302 RepID=A0A364Y4J4_9BACT|nr:thiol-disulfide oxidoreductase DCC family protein [Pseudochryseolinea flava]RAW01669.1 hypothetical protein DQQ10_08425 [Pseudochryseolinea flava]
MQIDDHPVVLFDGVCNLCNGAVQFVIKRDPDGIFKFASLQSTYAKERLAEAGANPDHLHSVAVLLKDKVYTKSDAAIMIAKHLQGPWRFFRLTRFVPRPLRDFVYTLIANNRYTWFGKKDQCMIPTPATKARFLA